MSPQAQVWVGWPVKQDPQKIDPAETEEVFNVLEFKGRVLMAFKCTLQIERFQDFAQRSLVTWTPGKLELSTGLSTQSNSSNQPGVPKRVRGKVPHVSATLSRAF